MTSKEIRRQVYTCEVCGNPQAVKFVEVWEEFIPAASDEGGYWGETPEEYGHYGWDRTEWHERVVRTLCPTCTPPAGRESAGG